MPQLVASVPVPLPQTYRLASIAPLELVPRSALLILQKASLRVCFFLLSIFLHWHPFPFMDYSCISFLAFETTCSSAGIPSVTINTNGGTPQSTPNTATLPSTTPVSVTTTVPTTRSQVVIGPSSTTSAPNTSLSVGSTSASTASIGGLPLKSSAFTNTNKIDFHWTVALLGLAVGNLLVF